MFNLSFQKCNPNGLSKIDYWKKWELFELFEDLHKVERLLIEFLNHETNDELLKFKNEFIEELYEIEKDNVADFTRIWEWFAPTKEWEMFCGQHGQDICNNIFRIVDKWKRNQHFIAGTKVMLNNEFGVVLDRTPENDVFGQISWDTNKENDIEDWRGLFSSFLEIGGQVIGQQHHFTFINDDGTRKKGSS
jgi:hypothetical protein